MKTKTKTFRIETRVGIVHAGLTLNRTFSRAIDAWEWAMWNYKGRNGWRLTWIEYLHLVPSTTPNNK